MSTAANPTVQAPPPTASWRATVPGVPAWARWCAHIAALTPVPSFLWRLPMAFGVPMGFSEAWMERQHLPGIGSVYVVVLGVGSEVLALLTLGLIQPWGERWPRWVRPWAGRRIHVLVPATLALTGAVCVSLFSVAFIGTAVTTHDADSPSGVWAGLMMLCYLPVLLWGPLLAITTIHYLRRRTYRSVNRREP